MTIFYLVRHGATPETGRKLSGWSPGIHLNEEGVAQAQGLAEMLEPVGFAAVYASPITRTVETARPIARAQGLTVTTRRALGEVDYGAWTGRSLKSLARTKLWADVLRFPSGARFPDGESLREVQARVVAELESIRLDHPTDKVCVVAHGDVIRLLAAHYLGVHIDLFQRIHVGVASVSVIGISARGPVIMALGVPFDGALV